MLTVSQIKKVGRLMYQTGGMDCHFGGPCDRAPHSSSGIGKESKEQRRARIKERFERMMAKSDEQIRWENCYQTATNPVEPERSGDPLYRKLGKVIRIARTKYDGLDGIIDQHVNDNYMIDLENRRMDINQYVELNNKSAVELYKQIRSEVIAKHNLHKP